jgi:hypothetical protein
MQPIEPRAPDRPIAVAAQVGFRSHALQAAHDETRSPRAAHNARGDSKNPGVGIPNLVFQIKDFSKVNISRACTANSWSSKTWYIPKFAMNDIQAIL